MSAETELVRRRQVHADAILAASRAAAAAADVQRLLDLHHLAARVVDTERGPAVLWTDVELVMPAPTIRPVHSHVHESGPGDQ